MRMTKKLPAALVGLCLTAGMVIGGAGSASAAWRTINYFPTKAKCDAARLAYVADYRHVSICTKQHDWLFGYDTDSHR